MKFEMIHTRPMTMDPQSVYKKKKNLRRFSRAQEKIFKRTDTFRVQTWKLDTHKPEETGNARRTRESLVGLQYLS